MSDEEDYMITTSDNPYNPFTEFDEWYRYDTRMGYHTSSLLARIIVTSDELPESDQDAAYSDAVEEMLRENVTGLFVKVARPKADA